MKVSNERIEEGVQEAVKLAGSLSEPPGNDKKLDDLGLKFIDRVEMIMIIEEMFGLYLPDPEIEQIKTVGELIEFVKKELP